MANRPLANLPAAVDHQEPMFRDHRDIVIADLADAEAALLARVADLEAERRWFREIAITAVHALHTFNQKLAQARDTIAALRAERQPSQTERAA